MKKEIIRAYNNARRIGVYIMERIIIAVESRVYSHACERRVIKKKRSHKKLSSGSPLTRVRPLLRFRYRVVSFAICSGADSIAYHHSRRHFRDDPGRDRQGNRSRTSASKSRMDRMDIRERRHVRMCIFA